MDIKSEIIKYSECIHEDLWNLAVYLYENPEIGYKEYKACEALSEFLKKHGFDNVETGSGGVETAFVATACVIVSVSGCIRIAFNSKKKL